jgi:hypothetical protein
MKRKRLPLLQVAISYTIGLSAALIWHFTHAASEAGYTASTADPQFWLHLLLEGVIALYTASMCLVIFLVLRRMKKGK